jgi:hypothetical protein
MSSTARAASVFARPFTGELTVSAAKDLTAAGIADRPDLVGQMNPITITFTQTADGFDANFGSSTLTVPGRTSNSSLNGNDIAWDFTSTDNNVDVALAHFTGTLALDEANDAFTINGNVAEDFLVTTLPAGATADTITVFSGTFTASQEAAPPPPQPPPSGIPLPAGVWAGLIGLTPLALLRHRLLATFVA